MASARSLFTFTLVIILVISSPARGEEKEDCTTPLTTNTAVVSAHIAETGLRKKGFNPQTAKGYAILIGAMVASAATTTFLTSNLPPNLSFLSQFVAQVSTLGVYVFGAPIWEPLSSGFRKFAFGVQNQNFSDPSALLQSSDLEDLWRQTQQNFSLNAQMSRNTITQFIISVQQNFYEAHRAAHSNNSKYAAAQIADAAYRLKVLFKDIPPSDPTVAGVVRSASTNHVQVDQAFIQQILERLKNLDPSFSNAESSAHYKQILEAWVL